MGKEEKLEALQEVLITAARQLIVEEGIEGVTVRKLGAAINYSHSKIYYSFGDKQNILQKVLDASCQELLCTLHSIPEDEVTIKRIVCQTLSYHESDPASVELLNAAYFAHRSLKLPKSFDEVETIHAAALMNMGLQSGSQVERALDVIRMIYVGAMRLISLGDAKAARRIAEDAIDTLIRGWKSAS